MKIKLILGNVALFGALILSSCSGGGSTMGSKSALFGNIPGIYEKVQLEFIEQMEEVKDSKDLEKIKALLNGLETSLKEAEEKAQPLAEKMEGKTVAYSMADSLPYQIVSDIRVEKVCLPEARLVVGSDNEMGLDVKFDVVVTEEVNSNLYLYYLLMDDETSLGYNRKAVGKRALGDTIHVEMTVSAPDIPAKYQESCNSLKFVTESTYYNDRKAIKKLQDQLNDEMAKELGLEEE